MSYFFLQDFLPFLPFLHFFFLAFAFFFFGAFFFSTFSVPGLLVSFFLQPGIAIRPKPNTAVIKTFNNSILISSRKNSVFQLRNNITPAVTTLQWLAGVMIIYELLKAFTFVRSQFRLDLLGRYRYLQALFRLLALFRPRAAFHLAALPAAPLAVFAELLCR